jgi:hypothetical protein
MNRSSVRVRSSAPFKTNGHLRRVRRGHASQNEHLFVMRVKQQCYRASCVRTIKKYAALYCSVKCQQEHMYERYILRWRSGEIEGTTTAFDKPSKYIRRHLMESGGFKCALCGWGERNTRTGLVPLHIDHIDGNARNNRPENLRLLCPNHHALTETYGNANKGNGRPGRRARYLKGVRFSPLIIGTAFG